MKEIIEKFQEIGEGLANTVLPWLLIIATIKYLFF